MIRQRAAKNPPSKPVLQHEQTPPPASVEDVVLMRFRIVELELLVAELKMEIARHHRDFERWEEMADKGAARIAENIALRERVAELEVELSDTQLELTRERFPGYYG